MVRAPNAPATYVIHRDGSNPSSQIDVGRCIPSESRPQNQPQRDRAFLPVGDQNAQSSPDVQARLIHLPTRLEGILPAAQYPKSSVRILNPCLLGRESVGLDDSTRLTIFAFQQGSIAPTHRFDFRKFRHYFTTWNSICLSSQPVKSIFSTSVNPALISTSSACPKATDASRSLCDLRDRMPLPPDARNRSHAWMKMSTWPD